MSTTTDIKTFKINYLTEAQYNAAKDNDQIEPNELYITPSGIGGVANIGEVQLFAGSTAPIGWMVCDGAAISREKYSDLFAVIGTTYGPGNGSTTFNIPNLSAVSSINYVICCEKIYSSNDPADYIVDQGTSGIWTYRKWNSGIAECWGRAKHVTPSSGALGVDYPTNLFVSIICSTLNFYYGDSTDADRNAQKYILTDGSFSDITDHQIIYVRDYAGNVVNPVISIDISVKGTWK